MTCTVKEGLYSTLVSQPSPNIKEKKVVWAARLILPIARPLSNYKHHAPPPLDLIRVESNVITNFDI